MANNRNLMGLAALAGGAYLLYANRFRIQRFLESQGVDTPWLTGNLGEAVKSGASKVSGSLDNILGKSSDPAPRV